MQEYLQEQDIRYQIREYQAEYLQYLQDLPEYLLREYLQDLPEYLLREYLQDLPEYLQEIMQEYLP